MLCQAPLTKPACKQARHGCTRLPYARTPPDPSWPHWNILSFSLDRPSRKNISLPLLPSLPQFRLNGPVWVNRSSLSFLDIPFHSAILDFCWVRSHPRVLFKPCSRLSPDDLATTNLHPPVNINFKSITRPCTALDSGSIHRMVVRSVPQGHRQVLCPYWVQQ